MKHVHQGKYVVKEGALTCRFQIVKFASNTLQVKSLSFLDDCIWASMA